MNINYIKNIIETTGMLKSKFIKVDPNLSIPSFFVTRYELRRESFDLVLKIATKILWASNLSFN